MNHRRPDFRLQPLAASVLAEAAALFPVVFHPWDIPVSRRAFFGVSLTAGTALLASRWASGTIAATGPVVAATIVDPELLSMVGIEADDHDTVEAGYHLRWFSDLPLPATAAPAEANTLQGFLEGHLQQQPLVFDASTRIPRLALEWRTGGRVEARGAGEVVPVIAPPDSSVNRVPVDSSVVGQTNNGTPPAYLIYRRAHQTRWVAPHHILLQKTELGRAAGRDGFDAMPGVNVRRQKVVLKTVLKDVPKEVWSNAGVANPGTVLAQLGNTTGDLVEVTFSQSNGVPRAIHRFQLFARSGDPVKPFLVEGFADESTEPVRFAFRVLRNSFPAEPNLEWMQGHYFRLVFVGKDLGGIDLRFGYMDEDTRVARKPREPAPGEWVFIAAVPFLTACRDWATAKREFFPHPIENRYLDYGGPLPSGDWSRRLDEKYAPLFGELQRVLLRMRWADMQGLQYLDETVDLALADARYEPALLYHLWSMDPLIASLLSQRYVDTPAGRSIVPPTPGTTYDYMVTTGWQPPAQRICYITQRVSVPTTPPVNRPRDVSAIQEEGFSRRGDVMLYRATAKWKAPAELYTDEYGYFEPPLYDVRRSDDGGPFHVLTQNYDHRRLAGEWILDSPVNGPVTPPPLDSGDLSAEQRAALQLRQTLQQINTSVAITAAQVTAYRQMIGTPLIDYFPLPPDEPPTFEYLDWVDLEASRDSRGVLYGLRSIDLFGRTSAWVDGTAALQITHNQGTPPAEDLRVTVDEAAPAETLAVRWRLGAHEIARGAPVNHFNVCWRLYDPDRDFAVVTYQDLLQPAQPADVAADVATATNALHAGTKTRAQIVRELCTSTAYATNSGFTNDGGFIDAVFHDLLHRAATTAERLQWLDQLTHGHSRGELVDALTASPDYRPGDPRRFRFWMGQMLATAIPATPPVSVGLYSVGLVGGTQIAGRITEVREPTGSGVKELEAAWVPGSRLVSLVTDQSFFGLPPFVAIAARYGAAASSLTDSITVTVGGQPYGVLGFEAGEVLTLTIMIPATGTDPVGTFRTSLGNNPQFTLALTTVKSELSWSQQLDITHLPEIGNAEDLPDTPPFNEAYAQTMLDRGTLEVLVSVPFDVEITGRELWLTRGCWLAYEEPAGTPHRVPIVDHGTLALSASELRFGTVWVDTTPPVPPPPQVRRRFSLTNHTSASLTVDVIQKSRSEFTVPAFVPTTLGPEAELIFEVVFTPPSTGYNADGLIDITDTLIIGTDRGNVEVKLVAHATTDVKKEREDSSVGLPRLFLGSVVLEPVVLDASEETVTENPVPVFPLATLTNALASSVWLNCHLQVPQLKTVSISTPTAASESGTGWRGADLSFVKDDREIVWPVVAQATVQSGRLRFICEEQIRLLGGPVSPDLNPPAAAVIRSVYRQSPTAPASLATAGARPQAAAIEIAVSTHRKGAAAGYTLELDSLVSNPVRVTLPSTQAPAPQVATPVIPVVWSDPFALGYATLPKMLDNQKVVQYKIKLDDSALMQGSIVSVPSMGQLELFRATLDALRVLMVEQMKLPVPADTLADPDLPLFTNRQPAQFSALSGDTRRSEVFQSLKQRSADELYRILAARLIRYWTHSTYSLKAAFLPIGRVFSAPPHFIDELTGVAAGTVFYAVAATQGQGAPDRRLLPFRIAIPDVHTPSTPTVTKRIGLDGAAFLTWPPAIEPDSYAFEVYRTDNGSSQPTRLRTLYLSAGDVVTGGEQVAHAPLEMAFTSRSLQVSRPSAASLGTIDLYFAASTLGLTSSNIVGVFAAGGLTATWALDSYNPSSDSANFWRVGVSGISANGRQLIGIDLPDTTQVILLYQDDDERHTLRFVSYNSIDLTGIPSSQRTTISGVYPNIPLVVWNNRVCLMFDSGGHGICDSSQITGVYRVQQSGSDGGYGSPTAENHWTNIWPGGSPNEGAFLSTDTRFLEGIQLPRGTAVVVEYREEGSSGTVRTLRDSFPVSDPTALPTAFYGILSQALTANAQQDPGNVVRIMDLSGPNTPTVAALAIKLDPALEPFLRTPSPVRVRYGASSLDTGSSLYQYADRSAGSTAGRYKVLAVRRPRISSTQFTMIRSV